MDKTNKDGEREAVSRQKKVQSNATDKHESLWRGRTTLLNDRETLQNHREASLERRELLASLRESECTRRETLLVNKSRDIETMETEWGRMVDKIRSLEETLAASQNEAHLTARFVDGLSTVIEEWKRAKN